MNTRDKAQYVLIIIDGAGDVNRILGRSPLQLARTNAMDFLARSGVSGLMRTLYDDLPRESLVAQLGMFGWSPHQYYPQGRASSELLALGDIPLGEHDLVFRANIVRMEGSVLASYSADYICSERARPIIQHINEELGYEFPDIELYHNSDFRNTLIVRNACVDACALVCAEPHESHGIAFNIGELVTARTAEGEALARHLNRYLLRVSQILSEETHYLLFPWGASRCFRLPSFHEHNGFTGRAAIVGNMDFLHGMAKAGGIDFYKVGNGRPDTDYRGKGRMVLDLLSEGYDFVTCHINGPDEASHLRDVKLKMESIEQIDDHIVSPVIDYFTAHPERLGAVMVLPDHYTNTSPETSNIKRSDTHSQHPVPFVLWNGRDVDGVRHFGEDDARFGAYGAEPVSHLDTLRILGVRAEAHLIEIEE